jgi:hypothetical protein
MRSNAAPLSFHPSLGTFHDAGDGRGLDGFWSPPDPRGAAARFEGRKPSVSLWLDGWLRFRFDDREFSAWSFALPPWLTRFEPVRSLPTATA